MAKGNKSSTFSNIMFFLFLIAVAAFVVAMEKNGAKMPWEFIQ